MRIKKLVVITVGVVALSALDMLLSHRSNRKKAQNKMIERDDHKESDSKN